jgi:superfamily I DNA/RNA helicase
MHGQAPQLKLFATQDEELSWLRDSIDALQVDGMQSQDICIVARTMGLVNSYADALKRLGVATKVISRRQPDHRSISGVRLATMHRVKGLEFRAVFMVGLNKGVVPLDGALRTKDPAEAEQRNANERSLFHVAATRAVTRLFVSCHGEPSEYLI